MLDSTRVSNNLLKHRIFIKTIKKGFMITNKLMIILISVQEYLPIN